jgi:hypothetical protein
MVTAATTMHGRSASDVTVVIPTHRQGAALAGAIRSVVSQSHPPAELLVVIDGPVAELVAIARSFREAPVRILELPSRGGAAAARNVGIAAARTEWVALLDHDDEWMPDKLERQMAAAAAARGRYPVVSSRLRARTAIGDFEWPRRLRAGDECIGDYLFSRRSFFAGEALLQSSTLLFRRELALRVPFSSSTGTHDDYDWCIRVGALPGVEWIQLPQVLAVWRFEDGRPTVSASATWQGSLSWIESVRSLISPRAYAGFLLTTVAARAVERADWRALRSIVRKAFAEGSPTLVQVAVFASICCLSPKVRRRLRPRRTAQERLPNP